MSLAVPKIRKYGLFRGADFTNAAPQYYRCPYLRNMYKDYSSQNGIAIETRPGFRIIDKVYHDIDKVVMVDYSNSGTIRIEFLENETEKTYTLSEKDLNKIIEVGSENSPIDEYKLLKLKVPYNYPDSNAYKYTFIFKVWQKNYVEVEWLNRTETLIGEWGEEEGCIYRIYISSVFPQISEPLEPTYIKKTVTDKDYDYIIKYYLGKSMFRGDYLYYEYGGKRYVISEEGLCEIYLYTYLYNIAHIPLYSIYDNTGVGTLHEPLNLLCNSYYVELAHVASDSYLGSDPQFFYSLPNAYGNELIGVKNVYKNGELIPHVLNGKYTYKINYDNDSNICSIAFNPMLNVDETEDYDYIHFNEDDKMVIELEHRGANGAYNPIKYCTTTETFEHKIFFSGNPQEPNKYYWSALDDPTYVPIVNYEIAGNDDSKINALMAINDTLYALKENGIYAISELMTNNEEMAATYPNKPLRTGIGSVSNCVARFEDDPVFMSKYGLKAIGRQSIYYERAIEHRSLYADGKMLSENLVKAKFAKWQGYLCILFPSGNMYLADSRQLYNGQYEWFMWTDIGLYANDEQIPVYDDAENTILRHTYRTGGIFYPAKTIFEFQGKLYFTVSFNGEENYICQFNTDIRRSDGTLQEIAYSDGCKIEYTQLQSDGTYRWIPELKNGKPLYGRPILNGLSTIRDNGGTYALSKTLNKKGAALLMKSFIRSGCKVSYKVSGDTSWHEMNKSYNTSFFDFEVVDFADTAFNVDDRVIVRIKKKVKKFDDISFLVYNNEVNKPFGIYEMQAEFFYGGYGK